jgi:hypothetical protein
MIAQIVFKGGEFYAKDAETTGNLARNSSQQRCASIAHHGALSERVSSVHFGKKNVEESPLKRSEKIPQKRIYVRILCDPQDVFLPKTSSYRPELRVLNAIQFYR